MEDLLIRIDLFEDNLNLLYSHVVNNAFNKDDLFIAFPFAVRESKALYRGACLPDNVINEYLKKEEKIIDGQYSFSQNFITALEFAEKDSAPDHTEIIICLRNSKTLSIESAYSYLNSEYRELLDEISSKYKELQTLDLHEYLLDKFSNEFQSNLDIIEEYTYSEEEFVLKSGKVKVSLVNKNGNQLQLNAIPA